MHAIACLYIYYKLPQVIKVLLYKITRYFKICVLQFYTVRYITRNIYETTHQIQKKYEFVQLFGTESQNPSTRQGGKHTIASMECGAYRIQPSTRKTSSSFVLGDIVHGQGFSCHNRVINVQKFCRHLSTSGIQVSRGSPGTDGSKHAERHSKDFRNAPWAKLKSWKMPPQKKGFKKELEDKIEGCFTHGPVWLRLRPCYLWRFWKNVGNFDDWILEHIYCKHIV